MERGRLILGVACACVAAVVAWICVDLLAPDTQSGRDRSSGDEDPSTDARERVSRNAKTGFHENGRKSFEMEYRDGRQAGRASFWHSSGRKALEGEYRDGRRDGQVTTWHQNGQKAQEGQYREGKKHGRFMTWLEDGRVWEEGEYRDGKRHGTFSLWDIQGNEAVVRACVGGRWVYGGDAMPPSLGASR